MHSSLSRVLAALGAITVAGALAACGSAASSRSATPVATSEATVAHTTPVGWNMPDLRGSNLQTAQDAIQALTDNPLFYTASEDASGRGRHQINDSNWTVCSQVPAAGATFDDETVITFQAVKVSEDCP